MFVARADEEVQAKLESSRGEIQTPVTMEHGCTCR